MDKETQKEFLEFIKKSSETLQGLIAPVQQRGGWESRDEAKQIYEFAAIIAPRLKQMKREVKQAMSDIRLSFDAQSPRKGGLFRTPVTRRDLDIQKRKALQPYQHILTGIDGMLTSLDGIKAGAKQAIDAYD